MPLPNNLGLVASKVFPITLYPRRQKFLERAGIEHGSYCPANNSCITRSVLIQFRDFVKFNVATFFNSAEISVAPPFHSNKRKIRLLPTFCFGVLSNFFMLHENRNSRACLHSLMIAKLPNTTLLGLVLVATFGNYDSRSNVLM